MNFDENEDDCCGSGCNPCILDARRAKVPKNAVEVRRERSAICPEKYSSFRVVSAETRSPYVLMTFDGRGPEPADLRFECGQYFILKKPKSAEDDAETSRPYTPLKHPRLYTFEDGGKFEGERGDRPIFQIIVRLREGGVVSEYLKRLKVGDETLWRGPYGDFEYAPNSYRGVLIACQGSAIVVAVSLATRILGDDSDDTLATVLYCCRGLGNALFRSELREMGANWNFRCRIFAGSDDGVPARYREPVERARLTREDLETEVDRLGRALVVVAGSEEFAKWARAALAGKSAAKVIAF